MEHPFQIWFEPYDVYDWTDAYQDDFHNQLTKIGPDTLMFKVFGTYNNPDFDGCLDYLIGYVVSRSEIVTSLWGDQKLFFKHKRIDEDFA